MAHYPHYNTTTKAWEITWKNQDGTLSGTWGDTEEECLRRYKELRGGQDKPEPMTKLERFKRIALLKGQLCEIEIRLTGRSTRLIDEYIQNLYKNSGQWVEITDHMDLCLSENGEGTFQFPTKDRNMQLVNRIMQRIAMEHPQDRVAVNKNSHNPRLMLIRQENRTITDRISQLKEEIQRLTEQQQQDQ